MVSLNTGEVKGTILDRDSGEALFHALQ